VDAAVAVAPRRELDSRPRVPTDHHSEYLARTLAALTPGGRRRVGELLDQLTASARGRDWVVRFATDRRLEADLGRTIDTGDADPGSRLTPDELDRLRAGFTTIRDQETLDDVADWANAVLQLLQDEAG
jgi:hypothetical protein